jgi:hypothetical protein
MPFDSWPKGLNKYYRVAGRGRKFAEKAAFAVYSMS